MNNWQARVIPEKQHTPLPACQINGVHIGDMQMNELYRPINDETEFRGDGYYNATVLRTGYFARSKPTWDWLEEITGQVFEGQEIIVQRLGDNKGWYKYIGNVGGNVAVPSYAEYEYFIHERHLTNIAPRIRGRHE